MVNLWKLRFSLHKWKKIPESVINSTTDVAKKVVSRMNQTGGNLPRPQSIMQDCDLHRFTEDSWIQNYLEYISDIFLEWYTPNKELLDFIAKTNKYHDIDSSINELVKQAFMDIYVLQIIRAHYWINKQKLKGLLFSNMLYWNKSIDSSITEIFVPLIDTEWRIKITIEELESKLEENKWNWKRDIPACPLHSSDYRNIFIEELWNYVEGVIIPLMQKSFSHSSFQWELFWSANVERLKETTT